MECRGGCILCSLGSEDVNVEGVPMRLDGRYRQMMGEAASVVCRSESAAFPRPP